MSKLAITSSGTVAAVPTVGESAVSSTNGYESGNRRKILRRLRHRWREEVGVYEIPGKQRRCGSKRKTVLKTALSDVLILGQETSVV